MSEGDPDWDDYPVIVELCFKTEDEKQNFMSQLSDGWGENHCSLDWPWKVGVDGFNCQPRFAVEVFDMANEYKDE